LTFGACSSHDSPALRQLIGGAQKAIFYQSSPGLYWKLSRVFEPRRQPAMTAKEAKTAARIFEYSRQTFRPLSAPARFALRLRSSSLLQSGSLDGSAALFF